MNKAKKLTMVAAALMLLVTLAVPVSVAQDDDTTEGKFTLANSDPELAADAVTLWTTGGSPTETTSMTPWVEYNVKVTVTDANTLDDLSTVEVTIFYDANGTYAAGDENCSAHTQNCAILTWTNGGSPPWTMSPSAPPTTTWSIETGNCVTPTLTSSTGTFEFHFKPGKVATRTADPAKWHIFAEADDGGGNPGSDTQENLTMNPYTEITVNTALVDWGSVSPEMPFAEGNPSEEAGISVTYIANGAYHEKVKATSPWTGAPSGTAALNAAGTPDANEFSLKADDTGTMGSDVLVSTSYQAIDDTGTQTGEDGDTVSTNSLWLKLGTPFSEAVYTGTIYYQITDGT